MHKTTITPIPLLRISIMRWWRKRVQWQRSEGIVLASLLPWGFQLLETWVEKEPFCIASWHLLADKLIGFTVPTSSGIPCVLVFTLLQSTILCIQSSRFISFGSTIASADESSQSVKSFSFYHKCGYYMCYVHIRLCEGVFITSTLHLEFKCYVSYQALYHFCIQLKSTS